MASKIRKPGACTGDKNDTLIVVRRFPAGLMRADLTWYNLDVDSDFRANQCVEWFQAEMCLEEKKRKPPAFLLDEEGRTVDAKTGQAITLPHHTPALKANIRAKRREYFKGLIDAALEEVLSGRYFDRRISGKAPQRQKRGFKFHKRGKFEQLVTRLRTKGTSLKRVFGEMKFKVYPTEAFAREQFRKHYVDLVFNAAVLETTSEAV